MGIRRNQQEENHCTRFPKPGPIYRCLLQPQQFLQQLEHLSDVVTTVLQRAATNQDSGLVSHCVYFELQLPRHKNLCVVVGFCLVLVHSSSYTEVLQKGTTLAAQSVQADVTSCCSSSVVKSQSVVSPVDTRAQPGNLSSPTEKGTSRGTMSEPSNPKWQGAWKCFPGHLGKNPLFNCNVLPHTASFVFHCNAILVALYNTEGKGTAQPTVNLLVTTC